MKAYHRVTMILAIGAASGAMLLASPPDASAAPLCEVRSAAHIAEHGGIHEDSRWHIARGELPNCDDSSNNAGSDHNSAGSDKKASSSDNDDKSRYCRKHVWC